MSGRGEDRGGDDPRGWLRGALIVVVIAGALGVFGAQTRLQRPTLSALNIAGIAVMLAGLAVSVFSRISAKRLGRTGQAAGLIKLGGVMVCGIGAAMVFL